MSLSWSGLHAQLIKSTQRMAFETHYQRIQHCHPEALPPGGIVGLLAFLHGAAATAEARNTALQALVAAAQGDHSRTGTTLLLLALWPGLDAVRWRLRRQFPEARGTLDGDLLGRLTLAIRQCDLARVNRIAATLLRNLERDVTRELITANREAPPSNPIEQLMDQFAHGVALMSGAPDTDHDVVALRNHLRHLLGVDAHLVLLVVVGGCTQREAGEMLGLSHDAARKRFRRAIARLKNLYADCPISPS